jgi:hypothetical protein
MAKSRKKGADAVQAAPQMSGDTSVANLDRERVAARAYELYQARGGGDGLAMDDWLAAEREFVQTSQRRDQS